MVGWRRLALQVGVAALALAGMIASVSPDLAVWVTADRGQRVLWLVGLVVGGVASYLKGFVAGRRACVRDLYSRR